MALSWRLADKLIDKIIPGRAQPTESKAEKNGRKLMRKRVWGFVLCPVLLALCIPAAAEQQPTKVPKIGLLTDGWRGSGSSRAEAFLQGLRDLGYIEGENIVIERRYAEGKLDRLPALAAELVRLKVDAIVTPGATVSRAAKEATATTPIVTAQDPDPVGNGFVASLARPGGNITGLSTYAPELSGKRLELMKEAFPRLARVAVLWNAADRGMSLKFREIE